MQIPDCTLECNHTGTLLFLIIGNLCLMNLYLHNIGDLYGKVPVMRGDALLSDPGYRVDYVLTNPPFGKKSSITFTNEEEEQEEEDLVYNRFPDDQLE